MYHLPALRLTIAALILASSGHRSVPPDLALTRNANDADLSVVADHQVVADTKYSAVETGFAQEARFSTAPSAPDAETSGTTPRGI